MNWKIHTGDCLDVLRTMPDNSVDAVVTDPPYGLAFMGKRWDYDVPSVEAWAECLRVLKPGGHLLAFFGTRTYHRGVVRVEDAGFEIRDCIAWLYGQGFPKSLDVSKAIDKINAEAGRLHKFTEWMRSTGVTARQINAATETFMASHYLTAGSQPAIPTPELWAKIRPMCGDVPAWVDELVARIAAEREVVGPTYRVPNAKVVNPHFVGIAGERAVGSREIEYARTAPATAAARQWQGWGTALKPAMEPIVVARKPLCGNVAQNVLRWGTGAVNVDGCRVGSDQIKTRIATRENGGGQAFGQGGVGKSVAGGTHVGRWPANVVHDGSEEVVALFPDDGKQSAARFFYCAKASKVERDEGCEALERKNPAVESAHSTVCLKCNRQRVNVSGSCQCDEPEWARVQQTPRGNHHPTVKPVALMAYLCRLVTPPGGVVLDPFTGSGSTGVACVREGFNFIGIEREAEYVKIAEARIQNATKENG